MPDSTFTITYPLTDDDWARAGRVLARTAVVSRGWPTLLASLHLLFWSCLGLTIASYAWIVDDSPAFKGPAQVMGLFFVMSLVLRMALEVATRRAAAHAWRDDVPHDVGLTVGDACLQLSYLGIVLQTPWARVRVACEDNRNLYLQLEPGSVLPVPLSSDPALLASLRTRAAPRRGDPTAAQSPPAEPGSPPG